MRGVPLHTDGVAFVDSPNARGADYEDILGLLRRPAWHAEAACRAQGTDLWFPAQGGDLEPAQAICAICTVTDECAEAGRREKFGIWGGVSDRGTKLARRTAA